MESVNSYISSPIFSITVSKRNPDSNEIPEVKLVPGMAFTIEPIVTMASTKEMLAMGTDNFSIVSPGNPSCQWEHIVLITDTGCEVLTKRQDETILS